MNFFDHEFFENEFSEHEIFRSLIFRTFIFFEKRKYVSYQSDKYFNTVFAFTSLKLDTHLNFGTYIDMVCGRVSAALASLYTTRTFLFTEALRPYLFFAITQSY